MTRINRPDTLLTELRDIKRRLHALETAQRATTTSTAQTMAVGAETSGSEATATEAATPEDESQ